MIWLWWAWISVAATLARRAHHDWVTPGDDHTTTAITAGVFAALLAAAAAWLWATAGSPL